MATILGNGANFFCLPNHPDDAERDGMDAFIAAIPGAKGVLVSLGGPGQDDAAVSIGVLVQVDDRMEWKDIEEVGGNTKKLAAVTNLFSKKKDDEPSV